MNNFSLSKKVTNILEKLIQAWPRVFITSPAKIEVTDLLRKTLARPSLATITRNLYLFITYFDKYRGIIDKIDIYRRVLESFKLNNLSTRLERSFTSLEKVSTK